MPLLLRKSIRDCRTYGWQMLGLAVLVAVITLVVTGGRRARAMLVESRATWYERLHFADLEIRFSPTHPGIAELARAVPGVARAEERLLAEGLFEAPELRPLPALIQVLPDGRPPTLNALHLIEGRYPEPGERAVVIDRSLVQAHGLSVGDQTTLRVGEASRSVPVVGVSLSPEHVLFPVHPEYTWPLRGTVAVVGISAAATAGIEKADRIDSLLIDVAEGADVADVERRLLDDLPLSVLETLTPADRPGHAFTEQILATFDIYMPTTAALLAIIGGTLLVMILLRLVQRQRRQMGILVTLGYGPLAIASSYLALCLLPTVVGLALGAAVTGPFSRTIFRGYAHTVGYLPLVDPGMGSELLWTAGLCSAAALVACFVPALALARHRPADLLTPSAWRTTNRALGPLVRAAARLRDVLGLPISVLLGLTHVGRRRGTTGAAVLGLGAILAVVTAFLLVHATHRSEIAKAIDRMGLDATVHFADPAPADAVAALAAATDGRAEPMISHRALLRIDDRELYRRVLCVEPGLWTDKLHYAEGQGFSTADEEGLVVDRWIAGTYDLHVGDEIDCFPNRNAPEGARLRIVGVLDGVSLGLALLPLETGRRLFGLDGLATGAQVASPLPEDRLEASLWEVPGVESVFGMRRAAAQVRANFAGSERVLLLALLMAIVVSIVFLGVLAALDATERGPDLVVLSALGWRPRSVLALCLTEVLTRGLLALVLGLCAAPFLADGLLDRIAAANHYRMPLVVPASLLLQVVGAALVALPLGAWPAWRIAQRLDPARALRRLTGE